MMKERLVMWFDELQLKDLPEVGGKNASLGEMRLNLQKKGVSIPDGYAITARAYRRLLESAGIRDKIKEYMVDLDACDIPNLSARGRKLRNLIRNAQVPQDLRDEIIRAYRRLCEKYGENTDVVVHSFATAEDLPDAGFTEQQKTFLIVRGEEALIDACKCCYASLYTDRAILSRFDKGVDHKMVLPIICVQKMVRSDVGISGIIFSIDTGSGLRNDALIAPFYGLGDTAVQVSPYLDSFGVPLIHFRASLKALSDGPTYSIERFVSGDLLAFAPGLGHIAMQQAVNKDSRAAKDKQKGSPVKGSARAENGFRKREKSPSESTGSLLFKLQSRIFAVSWVLIGSCLSSLLSAVIYGSPISWVAFFICGILGLCLLIMAR